MTIYSENNIREKIDMALGELTKEHSGKYFKVDRYCSREIFDFYIENYAKNIPIDNIKESPIMKIREFMVSEDTVLVVVVTPYNNMEFKLLLSEVYFNKLFESKDELQLLIECGEI